LFGPGLGVARKTGRARGEKHLERVDALGVRGHRDDGDHPAAQAARRRVRPVVADDHRGPALVRLGTPDRIEIDPADLPPTHQARSSAITASQSWPSSLPAHSAHASSYEPLATTIPVCPAAAELHVEADLHHVAVGDLVVLALDAELAQLAGLCPR